MTRRAWWAAAGLAVLLGSPVAAQEQPATAEVAAEDILGDADAGERVFRRCQSCHAVGADAENKVGPVLNGLIGRPAAAVEDFGYSDAMRDAAEAGLVWTLEDLHEFLAGPKDKVPGTIMSFPGLRNEEDRDDVIAYIFEASSDDQGSSGNEE